MARLMSLVTVCFLAATASAQTTTDLEPLELPAPRDGGPTMSRFRFGVEGAFSRKGLLVQTVSDPKSPLLDMIDPVKPRSRFEIEKGDLIVGVRDGQGRFVAPSSAAALATALESLPRPSTHLLIRDVRISRNRVFSVKLLSDGGGSKPPAEPGKVVVVLMGLTDDPKIGEAVKATFDVMRKVFETPSIKKHVSGVYEVMGADYSRRNIINRINSIPVRENDTLLCYINGHGAYDPKGGDYSNGHHFQILTGDLWRRELRQALQLKNARLTCLFSDACNVYTPFFPEPAPRGPPSAVNKRFESLFLGPRGYVDVNASSLNEFSWTYIFGPCFMYSLVSGIVEKDANNPTTWSQYLTDLTNLTAARYRERKTKWLEDPNIKPENAKALRDQASQTVRIFENTVRYGGRGPDDE